MTTARVVFNGAQMGERFKKSIFHQAARVRKAARDTAQQAADEIQTRGRADIADGGNFGSGRWQDLNAVITEGGGFIKISVSHGMGAIFGIFEYGGVIRGNPLLYFKPTPGFVKGDPDLIAVPSVTMPQKFHVRDICRDVASEIPTEYKKIFSQTPDDT